MVGYHRCIMLNNHTLSGIPSDKNQDGINAASSKSNRPSKITRSTQKRFADAARLNQRRRIARSAGRKRRELFLTDAEFARLVQLMKELGIEHRLSKATMPVHDVFAENMAKAAVGETGGLFE